MDHSATVEIFGSSGTQRISVLLIEDDACYQLLTRTSLQEDPAMTTEVVTTERLSEGLAALSGFKFDLILTDLNLPDSMGIATFQRLFAAAPEIPIIVLSNQPDETIAPQILRLGAQNYMSKAQMGPGVLNRIMRQAIESHRHLTELAQQLTFDDVLVQAIHEANVDAVVSTGADKTGRTENGRRPWPLRAGSTSSFGLGIPGYSASTILRQAFPALERMVCGAQMP